MKTRFLPLLCCLAWIGVLTDLEAGEYRRFPTTISPDGAYVLGWGQRDQKEEALAGLKDITGQEDEHFNIDDDLENYLVDAVKGQPLAVIPEFHYFSGPEGHQNHHDLQVAWSPDGKGALAIYDGRWEYSAMVWIEPQSRRFTEVGKSMEAAFRRLLAKREKSKDAGAVSFQNPIVPKPGTLIVEGWAQVPKSLEDPVYHYRLKFQVSGSEGKIRLELIKSALFSDADDQKMYAGTESASADQSLNKVYGQWRATLNDAGKEALKQEQLRWLKARDTIKGEPSQDEYTVHRIRELRTRVEGW